MATKHDETNGWRRSSYCASGTCVEVSLSEGSVVVRHSRTHACQLTFTSEEWSAFVRGVKNGEFDSMAQ